MLKDEQVGKKIDLAEQRALAGTQGGKGELTTFGRRGRQLWRTIRMLWGYAGPRSDSRNPRKN